MIRGYSRTLGVGACLLAGAAFVLGAGDRYHGGLRALRHFWHRGELGAFADLAVFPPLEPQARPGGEVLWAGATTWSLDRLEGALVDHLARHGFREAPEPPGMGPFAQAKGRGSFYADRDAARCLVAAVRAGRVSCAVVLDLGAQRRVVIGSGPLARGVAAEPDLEPLRRMLPPQLQPERLLEGGDGAGD